MKEILTSPQFLVRIDENGKEVEKPRGSMVKGGSRAFFGSTPQLNKEAHRYDNTTEAIKLPTLSEFINYVMSEGYWLKRARIENTDQIDSHLLKDINFYRLFLQQPLTKEMFIGEDAIFVYSNQRPKGDYLIEIWQKHNTIEQALNNNVTLYLNPNKI